MRKQKPQLPNCHGKSEYRPTGYSGDMQSAVYISIGIIINRHSGINPISPTVEYRDGKTLVTLVTLDLDLDNRTWTWTTGPGPGPWVVPGQVLMGKPSPGAGNQLQTG